RSYAQLAYITGCQEDDDAEGHRLSRHAQAVLAAIGGDVLAEGCRLKAIACMKRQLESDVPGSIGDLEDAIRICTKEYGHDLFQANLLTNLGIFEQDNGHPQRAFEVIDEAVPSMEALLGPEHPELAFLLINKAAALNDLYRIDEALATAQRGIALR